MDEFDRLIADGQLQVAIKYLLYLHRQGSGPYIEAVSLLDTINTSERDFGRRLITYEKHQTNRERVKVRALELRWQVPSQAIPRPPAPGVTPLLAFTNLQKTFGAFRLVVESFDVHAAQLIGVVGPNASGKTTLLRCIAGELAGDGNDAKRDSACRTIFVPQQPGPWAGTLPTYLSRQAAYGGTPHREIAERVQSIIDLLGLRDHESALCSSLSAGTQMRCAIAAALLQGGKVLVLDEPLGPLDVRAQQLLLAELRLMSRLQRVAIIVSSQHVAEVEYVADATFLLRRGVCKPWRTNPIAERYFEVAPTRDQKAIEQLLVQLSQLSNVKIIRPFTSFVLVSAPESLATLAKRLETVQASVASLRDVTHSAVLGLHLELEHAGDAEAP